MDSFSIRILDLLLSEFFFLKLNSFKGCGAPPSVHSSLFEALSAVNKIAQNLLT